MIKDNQKYFNRLHLLVDAAVVAVSYLLAWYIKFCTIFADTEPGAGALDMRTYFSFLYFVVPEYIVLYYFFNMYAPKRATRRKYEIENILKANTVGIVFFIVVLYIIKQPDFSRFMMGAFFVINIVFTVVCRTLIRNMLLYFRRKGYNLKYMLLVGYSRAAEEYITRINANPQWGYVVRGILDDRVPSGTIYKGVKVVGRIENIKYILPENKLDEIAITLALKDYDRLENIVDLCEKSGVHTKFIPDYNSLVPSQPYTEDLMGLPVINIRYVPLTNTLNWVCKRAVDILGSLAGIILFSPIMLIAALAVKLTSRGPVIFKQERVGLHNKTFKMYKFRTMETQKAQTEQKAWTVKDDPRVTKIGRFLRHTSLDELPQLFNILAGEMSLVGPRPERPQFVEKFKEEIPRYMIKHQVRPGLTGWAQINGYRGDTSIRKRIEHDLFYIENWTMSLDFKIMFLTIFKGFINKNAY
ncbi:undecaprenyl-phosphate glucose phosphotransferase [Parablautia intestinalis]|jgi:Undecaprenyl-phosphate glucose phosphotransferase|uniref:Undecaprenyl-phosphate glucose phosphotransferase n=1 Tax=Parablautia intestinalis TaxID=2320100 RepID=A0A3A9B5M0_9FIRM|nr:undecaprenyl-phosphate glucose phosphotransferase [Parablautia intestinalis]MCI8615035.1 undecaprenyl-phosphate glucose phosphotransferase [Lachnospiraceae bacterium]MDE7047076.1 undecaprenyl-phosphate glucose phosphotransferase [Lachnospiraceae bacterium]RKI94095.1 undecaprenyl-phosphate glucose phosphotransferase [Parablautia intestinalis]